MRLNTHPPYVPTFVSAPRHDFSGSTAHVTSTVSDFFVLRVGCATAARAIERGRCEQSVRVRSSPLGARRPRRRRHREEGRADPRGEVRTHVEGARDAERGRVSSALASRAAQSRCAVVVDVEPIEFIELKLLRRRRRPK